MGKFTWDCACENVLIYPVHSFWDASYLGKWLRTFYRLSRFSIILDQNTHSYNTLLLGIEGSLDVRSVMQNKRALKVSNSMTIHDRLKLKSTEQFISSTISKLWYIHTMEYESNKNECSTTSHNNENDYYQHDEWKNPITIVYIRYQKTPKLI